MDNLDIIKKLDKVYERVLILNNIIKNTDSYDINKYMIKFKEYHELQTERQKLQDKWNKEEKPQIITLDNGSLMRVGPKRKGPTILEQQIRELDIKINQNNINTDNDIINNIYRKYFVNDPIYMQSDDNIDIKLYKIVNFNLEKRKELAIIMDEYKSIDNIKSMLRDLYQKQIDDYTMTSI